jgi:hypothetical protein
MITFTWLTFILIALAVFGIGYGAGLAYVDFKK